MKKASVPALLSAFLLASCANVTFHPSVPDGTGTAPNLSKQTGLKYYTAKPYLLIAPTGNKDAPLKAEIISLPDLEHPTYAIYHPGWGQHIFSLAVASNGNLSSYGQTADSKIPETITALGSLMGGAGSLATAIKPLIKAMATAPPRGSPKVLVQEAIDELSKIASVTQQNDLVRDRARRAEEFKRQLSDLIEGWPAGEALSAALTQVSKLIKSAKIENARGETPEGHVNQYFNQAKEKVDQAIEALEAGAPKKPDVRLFEIRMENGKTKLIPVDMPALTGT
jgi:hypothetical protein